MAGQINFPGKTNLRYLFVFYYGLFSDQDKVVAVSVSRLYVYLFAIHEL